MERLLRNGQHISEQIAAQPIKYRFRSLLLCPVLPSTNHRSSAFTEAFTERRKSADLLQVVFAALLKAVVGNAVPVEPVAAQPRWVARSARAGLKAPVSSAAKPANFKVRINATAALVEAKTLAHYGASFVPVLACISRTLANFEEDEQVPNYREVKYRKTLYEALTRFVRMFYSFFANVVLTYCSPYSIT